MDKGAAWVRRHPLVAFFALAYSISWLAWLGVGLTGLFASPWGKGIALLGAFGPSLAGLLLTGALQGRLGLSSLLGRLAPWRGGLAWCLAALAVPPTLTALVMTVAAMLSGLPAPLAQMSRIDLLIAPFVSMLVIGGASEEIGWRGYALPRLRLRHGPLVSSLILGLLWGFWHLPAYTLPSLGAALPLPQFLVFALTTPAVAALFTWLAENSRGNLAVAALFHASLNASAGWPGLLRVSAPGFGQLYNLGFWLCVLLVAVLPRPWGWRVGKPASHRLAGANLGRADDKDVGS